MSAPRKTGPAPRVGYFTLLAVAGWLAGCSDGGPPQKAQADAKVAQSDSAPASALPAPASDAPPSSAMAAVAPLPASSLPAATAESLPAANPDLPPLAQTINAASFTAPGAKVAAGWKLHGVDPTLIKTEVLLDRAGFSPGVIDGRKGQNLSHALAAFDQAHSLPASATLDAASWNALSQADGAPVMQTYQITSDDLAGPFIGVPPKDYAELAKLPALGYTDPQQLLSEKFHMDRKLLTALNPNADFTKVGTSIIVTAPRAERHDLHVTRIEVDKSQEVVRAYDDSGKLVGFYPATVGSTERPAPSGTFTVKGVAPHPVYYYDPTRLTFTPEGATGKLKIAAGPNNPVGSTWIALTIPTYGIHGAPDPSLIGKRQSHGCVRLTNWDAVELGRSVKPGTKVVFLGQEKA